VEILLDGNNSTRCVAKNNRRTHEKIGIPWLILVTYSPPEAPRIGAGRSLHALAGSCWAQIIEPTQ
jgi:hypothetical protein